MTKPSTIMPPIMVRSAVCRDMHFVGTLTQACRQHVNWVNSSLNESLAFLMAKYPFLGIAFCLYFTEGSDPVCGSAKIINCNTKTAEEHRILRRTYIHAKLSKLNLSTWMPLLREIGFDKLHRALGGDLKTASEYHLTGSITVEFPGGSGATIFIEGGPQHKDEPTYHHYFVLDSPRSETLFLGPSGSDQHFVGHRLGDMW